MNAVERYIPIIHTIRTYNPGWFRYDLIAGLSIFAVLIPSAMAYGSLAGVPPVNGLYAALVGMVIYAIFASSRMLVVGPEATTSLLVASTIASLSISDPAQYLLFAAALALVAGGLMIAAGFLRLGFVAEFLSAPVLIGFMNGGALIIIGSQLSKLFGVQITSDQFFQQIYELFTKLDQTQGNTLAISVIAIIVLILLRAIAPKLPAALIVVGGALVFSLLLDPGENGIATVGDIPLGLPAFQLPTLNVFDLIALLPGAISVAVLTVPNTVLTARIFADKVNQEIDPNQELIAVGLANAGTAFFQGFPISGSQSRTGLNASSGAKSQISSIVCAAVLVVFLILLAPILEGLPLAVLGAIIVVTAINLIDIRGVVKLFRIQFFAGILSIGTTIGVLTIGIIPAIMVAVILSLFYLISRIYRPSDAVLGQLAEGQVFEEVNTENYINPFPGLVVYRFDAPLFFANVQYFVQRVRQIAESQTPVPKILLLNAEAITGIDVTAGDTLKKLLEELRNKGIDFYVARASVPFRKDLAKLELDVVIGQDHFYSSVRNAVQAYLSTLPDTGEAAKEVDINA